MFTHLFKHDRFITVKLLEVAFNKEKSLVEAFSMHCETSRRFIDSSKGQ